MIFADTNILVYAFEASEPLKRAIASQLLRDAVAGRDLVLSTQVLQEFYVSVLRKRLLEQVEAEQAVRLWSENRVIDITPGLVLEAIELHQKHRLSYWDALVVRAAAQAGCTLLYSEDLQHGRKIAGLEIVNPFAREVHEEPASYLVTSAASSVDKILREAIIGKRLISFAYEGRPKQGEPHDYGLNNGKRRLNFYQTQGRNKAGVEEAGLWKTLDPAKITQLRLLPGRFAGTRETARGAHKRWDELFATVTPR